MYFCGKNLILTIACAPHSCNIRSATTCQCRVSSFYTKFTAVSMYSKYKLQQFYVHSNGPCQRLGAKITSGRGTKRPRVVHQCDAPSLLTQERLKLCWRVGNVLTRSHSCRACHGWQLCCWRVLVSLRKARTQRADTSLRLESLCNSWETHAA